MRICLLTSSFLPTIGGAELVVHYLATYMTKQNHTVVVFAPLRSRQLLTRKRLTGTSYITRRYFIPPRNKLMDELLALQLLIEKRRSQFDILHVHKARPAYAALKVKNFLNVPIIVTTHGGDLQTIPKIGYGDRLDHKVDRKITYALKNADCVTAISSNTKKEYLRIGIPEKKICLIPNGVDIDRFRKPSVNIQDKLKLPNDIRLLLSVGRNFPEKGYQYLIQSMNHVVKYFNNVKCMIIGRRTKGLIPLVEQLGLQRYVILLEQFFSDDKGFIDMNDIPNKYLLSAYFNSEIFVSSSLIEGFPLAPLEAMAAGLPVVATNVPGNQDVVINGKNGFLVKPMDAKDMAEKIITLLTDDNLKQKLGENSREFAKQYAWDSIADKYLKIYSDLIYHKKSQ